MIRRSAITVFAAAIAFAAALHAAPPAALAPYEILLGEWQAIDDPSGATGGFTFSYSVQDRVIVRTNYASYPAANGKPASRHDDLMVIFIDGDVVRADYFDSEGHIIRYAAEARPDQIVFLSEIKASEPRYRLLYRRASDGLLHGRFDVAPPGKPDTFSTYLSWSARKR